MKKIQWPRLLAALLLPLAVGGLSAWLTGSFSETYGSVYKPLLSPPGWVFPVVWTALYLLMGYASYLVWTSDAADGEKKGALTLYAVQLFFNFVWPLLFFRWRLYWIAFVWLVLLWVLILLTKRRFDGIDRRSGLCLAPYLVWVTFAAYLNLGVSLLNR